MRQSLKIQGEQSRRPFFARRRASIVSRATSAKTADSKFYVRQKWRVQHALKERGDEMYPRPYRPCHPDLPVAQLAQFALGEPDVMPILMQDRVANFLS